MISKRHCAHIDAITSLKHPKRRECAECLKTGATWVHLRTCQECGTTAVLRRLSEPPRQEACPRDGPSRHRIRGAGWALAVLLSGRRVRGM